ncbi:hypothetical protein EYC80_003435 [Monilinia laxa]|uniref:Uncharacterized protein n=1 Tax=Monilinia laxa TaxID=61186 RepID=A0A5N6KDP6_MONLA|nr:hypothetical protein EYC80_003435 [Monilinia laxa]
MYGFPMLRAYLGCIIRVFIGWQVALLLCNEMDERTLGIFCISRNFQLVASFMVDFYQKGVEWRLDWLMAFENVIIRTFQAIGTQTLIEISRWNG